MGRGGTSAREISFVSLVAYGPNSDSALTMGGLQPLKPGRAVPNKQVHEKMFHITNHHEMQMKTTKEYHFTSLKMTIIKKTKDDNC